jgi:DNA replication and repair protein RecF
MELRRLFLQDWRNISRADCTLPPGLTLVTGDNAQGKTNLLEADLVRLGKDEALAVADVARASGVFQVSVRVRRRGRKERWRDGKPFRSGGDPLGDLRVVLFSPEDLELVKGGPAARRRYLDRDLGQLFPGYQERLADYRRSLQQRNALLRRGISGAVRTVWDETLERTGLMVTEWRRRMLAEVAPDFQAAYREMSSGHEEASLVYLPNLEEDPELRRQHLQRLAVAESARGTTLWGPHRDDIAVRIGENDARAFSSQGQQRSAAIALKIAALRYAERIEGERPVLLLDDVLSELDSERRRSLVAFLVEGQTILTAATGHDVPDVLPAAVLSVRGGEVEVRGS